MDTFARNEVGRRLSNIAPAFTRELVEAAFPNDIEAQITFLSEALRVLGGARLRRTHFCIDDMGPFEGFTYGDTWNGWACPYFTKEVGEQIMLSDLGTYAGEGKSFFQEESDSFIWDTDEEGNPDEFVGVDTPEGKLYPIGAHYWTWDEDEESYLRSRIEAECPEINDVDEIVAHVEELRAILCKG